MSLCNIAIRVDASTQIGTGHFMRCVALGDVLKEHGSQIRFVSRCLPEYLKNLLIEKGHDLIALNESPIKTRKIDLAHSQWLGTSQKLDAEECILALSDKLWDWLIVDHYALDARWEKIMRQITLNILVIDDLVDRQHDCDVLLDQTYGRKDQDYEGLVSKKCKLLTGSNYSLLRPEFTNLREYSLNRRIRPKVKHILVSMGGVDKFNVTEKILQVLQTSDLLKDCQITVVMGKGSPWIDSVRKQARKLPCKTEVEVGVNEVGRLMAESDLAIGAAGSTAWERCCLGLPTIMLVLADNQKDVAQHLDEVKAVVLVREVSEVKQNVDFLLENTKKLTDLSKISSSITDGNGLKYVFEYMREACG
jgi:UDP-2,4-diacetamido-2,4,6-trideoxy-beta-L-altropyranose hydrolase